MNTGRLPKVILLELPVHFLFEWDNRQIPDSLRMMHVARRTSERSTQ